MVEITILNQNNRPQGPFTRAQVAQKLARGEFTLDSLAHVEGLAQWTPLRDVLARVDAGLPPPPVPAPLSMPPVRIPAYSYAATMQPPAHLVYAGFWLRVVAHIVDALILGVPMMLISGGIGFVYGMNHPGMRPTFTNVDGSINFPFVILELCIMTVTTVVYWLYYALQESSSAQATIGKQVVAIKVTSLEGQRIGFGQASGRYFGKIISSLTLLIGYMMAGFTERKQALHDMIAGTLVIRR